VLINRYLKQQKKKGITLDLFKVQPPPVKLSKEQISKDKKKEYYWDDFDCTLQCEDYYKS